MYCSERGADSLRLPSVSSCVRQAGRRDCPEYRGGNSGDDLERKQSETPVIADGGLGRKISSKRRLPGLRRIESVADVRG